MRKLGSVIAPGGAVYITICPTLACNFECPYCFEDRGRGKMASEIQDDIVRLAERMLIGSAKGERGCHDYRGAVRQADCG